MKLSQQELKNIIIEEFELALDEKKWPKTRTAEMRPGEQPKLVQGEPQPEDEFAKHSTAVRQPKLYTRDGIIHLALKRVNPKMRHHFINLPLAKMKRPDSLYSALRTLKRTSNYGVQISNQLNWKALSADLKKSIMGIDGTGEIGILLRRLSFLGMKDLTPVSAKGTPGQKTYEAKSPYKQKIRPVDKAERILHEQTPGVMAQATAAGRIAGAAALGPKRPKSKISPRAKAKIKIYMENINRILTLLGVSSGNLKKFWQHVKTSKAYRTGERFRSGQTVFGPGGGDIH